MLFFTLFFTIIGWGLSALLIFAACKSKVGRRLSPLVMAGCFFALGTFVLLGYVLDSAKLFAIGISLPIGVLLAFLSVYDLLKYRQCTVSVTAQIKEIECVWRRRGRNCYVPLFCYQYLGKTYEAHSFIQYSRRKAERLFVKGARCELRIDPRDPEICVNKRTKPHLDFLMLFFALCLLAYSVFLICAPAEVITLRV